LPRMWQARGDGSFDQEIGQGCHGILNGTTLGILNEINSRGRSSFCIQMSESQKRATSPLIDQGYLRVFRICRLFDYVNHCWVDYDGTPLTPSLLEH
jgi:hypothetical protein